MDHCQLSGSVGHYIQERKDQIRPQYPQTTIPPTVHNNEDDDNNNNNNSADKGNENAGGGGEQADGSLYDDIIQDGDEMASIGGHFLGVEKSVPKAQAQTSNRLPAPVVEIPNEKLHTDETTDPSSRPFLVSLRQLLFPPLSIIITIITKRGERDEACFHPCFPGSGTGNAIRERSGQIPSRASQSGRRHYTERDTALVPERQTKEIGDRVG